MNLQVSVLHPWYPESLQLSQRLLPQRLPATLSPPIYVGIMKNRKKKQT